ncbi:MAG: hypothetical protein ACTSSH_02275 [Candidatus Heimdallarchaeota archaeon]
MDKKNINELLDQLVSPLICKSEKLSLIIHLLLDQKEYFCYRLICFFLDNYHKVGNLRASSKNELQDCFSLGKSQLTVNLQKAREQRLVRYEKRKYSLNMNHSLVQRLWNYYFLEKQDNPTKINDFTTIIQEYTVLKEELRTLQVQLNDFFKLKQMNLLDDFCENIMTLILDEGDRSQYYDLCKNYKLLLVGVTE